MGILKNEQIEQIVENEKAKESELEELDQEDQTQEGKRKVFRNKLEPILKLFSVAQICLYMLVILGLSTVYLYLTTRHLAISLAVGILTLGFSFYYLVYIPKKLQREIFLMKELQKYATNVIFFLQSGYNVPDALQMSKDKLDPEIQEDIDKTIESLEKEAVLKTDHFRKYKFPSINIFHQNLRIKYEVGGTPKELFSRVNKYINFEIVARDKLYRRKKYAQNRIHVMILMVLSFPLIFLFSDKEIYDKFLEMGYPAIATNVSLFIAILISMLFLQRATADISLLD